jgi:hypothetical protein
MTNSGAALFYTDSNYNVTTTTYMLSSGMATIYVIDTNAQTITLTATDTNSKTGTSGVILINPAVIDNYVVTATTPQTAGTGWSETITAKDIYANTVLADSSTVVTMTNSGAALFYTDNNYNVTATTYMLSSGMATIYVMDETAQTITLTATDTNSKTGSSGVITINSGSANAYSLNTPPDMVAGNTLAHYILTRRDVYGNLVTAGAETANLQTTSPGANAQFRLTVNGSSVTTVDFANGESTTEFYYYDELMGSYTITASHSGVTDGTDAINVAHYQPDHLVWTGSVATPQTAGGTFILPAIRAVDPFGNVLNNLYGATPYTGTMTLSYTLSGVAGAPNGSATDSWTTSVAFTDGVSTTTLNTILRRVQTTTITPSAGNLPGSPIVPNVSSNLIQVVAANPAALVFLQQPSATATVNVAFSQQSIVVIQDTYGNQTTSTAAVTMNDSSSGSSYQDAAGALLMSINPLAAVSGFAAFSGIQYNTVGTIYLYATSSGLTPAFSTAVAVSPAVPENTNLTVETSFVYDEASDRLVARLWLELSGALIRNSFTSVDKLGDATIEIFDDGSNTWFPAQTIPHPDFNDYTTAIYRWNLDDAVAGGGAIQLVAGKAYFARCVVNYGGPAGNAEAYETGTTFTITTAQAMAGITADISGLQSQIVGIQTSVTTEGTLTREQLAQIQADADRLLTAAETTIPDKIIAETGAIKTKVATMAKSGILNRENTALAGSTLTIRYRTYPGASPLITTYDPAGASGIAAAPMAEVAEGLYAHAVTFSSGWSLGDHTIVCQEPSYGTMDAIVITVKSVDIETVSSDVSAVLGSVAPVRDLKSTMEALSAALNLIEQNISKATESLVSTQAGSLESADALERVAALYNTLKELSSKIKALGGTDEFDVNKFYEMSDVRAKDIDYLRNKTQEMKALLQLNQEMLEATKKEDPLVTTWMEFS